MGYEVPTNLQNFTQKDLTEVKIFRSFFFGGGYFFLKHPVYSIKQVYVINSYHCFEECISDSLLHFRRNSKK